MRGSRALLLLLGVLAGPACSPASQPEGGRAAPASVSLVPVTYEEWQEKLAGFRGQIVVVDLWATWCIPCIERFPKMVELDHRYRDRGVRFVSLCLDDRDDSGAVERARQFLQAQQATFDNFLMNEEILDGFEKLGVRGIPAVFVYDRQGTLRHRLTGDDPNRQFTEADVEAAVQELLEAPAAG